MTKKNRKFLFATRDKNSKQGRWFSFINKGGERKGEGMIDKWDDLTRQGTPKKPSA